MTDTNHKADMAQPGGGTETQDLDPRAGGPAPGPADDAGSFSPEQGGGDGDGELEIEITESTDTEGGLEGQVGAAPTSRLSQAVLKLREEGARTHDRLLRTAAELDNFKKRSRKELAERIRQNEDQVVTEFLPVVDNLELALSHADPTQSAALADGVQMVHKQFLAVLERYGILPVEAVGQVFDPLFHEAVQQSHSDLPAGVVCLELRRGYRREDRLVRAALVVVSLGPPPKASVPGEGGEQGPGGGSGQGEEEGGAGEKTGLTGGGVDPGGGEGAPDGRQE